MNVRLNLPSIMSASKLVLPPQYSRRILIASSVMSASAVSAYYNGCYDNCVLAVLVLCSSLNYWRHPTFGVRRSFDMLCANGSLAYQVFYTSQRSECSSKARMAYLFTVMCGGTCYFAARRFNFRYRNLNISSALHVCLHLFGNLGNLILYDSLGANALGLGHNRQ